MLAHVWLTKNHIGDVGSCVGHFIPDFSWATGNKPNARPSNNNLD
jgi:hypothetical protein